MSRVDFAIPDFCSLISDVPALAGKFLAGLHWTRQKVSGMSGNHRSDFQEPVCGLLPDWRPSTWSLSPSLLTCRLLVGYLDLSGERLNAKSRR